LKDWGVPNWGTVIISNMLKADIFYNGEVYDNETGTPQGGVISPLLANVALTALDNFCYEKYGRKNIRNGQIEKITPIVRYADDFVIVCKSEPEAIKIKSEVANFLQEKIGLTLSEEKTRITHITKGFDFLGLNIRKYLKQGKLKPTDDKWKNYKLLIKPQKEKVLNLLRNCKEVLIQSKTATQRQIIFLLNPKLVGWAMYYRHNVAKRTFENIDSEMWLKLYRWAKRRHPNKSKSWIINKYYSRVGRVKAVFRDKDSDTILFRLSGIPIKRFVKVKNGMRVYDRNPQTMEYWKKREYVNAYNQIHSVKMQNLYERQKGKCLYCREQITQEEIQTSETHIHHLKPVSHGGYNGYSNLRLLHSVCHKELHAKFSRETMSEFVDKKVDYINNPTIPITLIEKRRKGVLQYPMEKVEDKIEYWEKLAQDILTSKAPRVSDYDTANIKMQRLENELITLRERLTKAKRNLDVAHQRSANNPIP
jgi:RNA-directed DNA polymerase